MWESISAALAFVVVVGAALIVLLSKRADQARDTDRENVRATRELLLTRDLQLVERTRDLDILKSEHKQLIQVNTKEIITAWQTQQQAMYFLENARLRLQIEELRVRLSQHETV